MCAEKYVIFTKKPDKRLAIVQSSFSHGSHFPVKGKNSLHVMSFCIWHVIIVLLNTFIGRKNGGSAHSIFVHFKCCILNFGIINLNIIYKHCYEHTTKSKSILVHHNVEEQTNHVDFFQVQTAIAKKLVIQITIFFCFNLRCNNKLIKNILLYLTNGNLLVQVPFKVDIGKAYSLGKLQLELQGIWQIEMLCVMFCS